VRFKCEIDNIRTLKKGMKLTLSLDDEQTREIMKHIYNFMDKPITIDLLIDEQEQRERLKQITSEQRKKIYANFTGYGKLYRRQCRKLERENKV